MTASESRAAGAAAEAVHHNTAPVIALAGLALGSEIMFDSHTHCRVHWEDLGWAALGKTTFPEQSIENIYLFNTYLIYLHYSSNLSISWDICGQTV